MFSTPPSGSKAIATNALRNAGLIDKDAQMRDVGDQPGGRKGAIKKRGRVRPFEPALDPSGTTQRMHAKRLAASSSTGAIDLHHGLRQRPSRTSGRQPPEGNSRPSQIRPIQKGSPVQWLKEFVMSRWDPNAKFLNLDNMSNDSVLKKYNLNAPGEGGSPRDAAVIFKLAGQLSPPVETLSLANNKLTGQHLTSLYRYLPDILNLSLQNNGLTQWRDIDLIAGRRGKLTRLRELVLIGNPLRELEYKNGRGDSYKIEMTRRFPALEVLDQDAVAQIAFDVVQPSKAKATANMPTYTSFPYDMGPSFITGVDGTLLSNFLVRFFALFDTNRNGLQTAYDPAATFSFSANTAIPVRARIEKYHVELANQQKLTWKEWLNGGRGGSRNLSRIGGGFSKTLNSLHIGGEEIVKAFAELPGTKHNIGGPPDRFSVDSFPVPHGRGMGLLLTIHGEFTEVGANGLRSFDRSFVLAPATEGSRAKQDSWDVMILSDQWIIRSYSHHDAWKPGPLLVQAQPQPEQPGPSQTPSLNLPPDQQAALATLPEQQRSMVLQVCNRTRLNVKYAVDCLTNNAWDLERAVANFNQVKTSLSRDAFL